ncbi:hypothetical protein FRB90_004688, partial [Tulasnella sp. 427]
MDFSDGRRGGFGPEKDVYLGNQSGPNHLARNKTERRRLQGLMQKGQEVSRSVVPINPKMLRLKERWDYWMVNDGARQLFMGVWVFLHLIVFAFGFMNYYLKDNLTIARATFGLGYPIARTAAVVLHVDVALILFPVCRNFISLLRRTSLNNFIPFDKNIEFHKLTGWSITFFSAVHIIAHMFNFARLAIATGKNTKERIILFLEANFLTGPGATGWVMTVVLGVMVWFAIEKRRRANFEWFWYTHHLFIIFFICWQLHGMFCMIKPDPGSPQCFWSTIGVFWKYWLAGGLIWIYERILREVRSRHRTYISKVIQHPSKVMEIQIKKEKTT